MTIIAIIFVSILGVALSSSQCGKIFDNTVSKSDATLIVDKHNAFRKLIASGAVDGQPRGVNLKRMKYDKKLATEAQKIANSCTFAHQTVYDDRWHAVGQNLYIQYSTGNTRDSDWSAAIQSWFDEYKDYTFGACCNQGPKLTGHYTQVVWADTENVGCGYTHFETKDFWRYRKLYVCNYGPAGNYLGQMPYKTGNAGCEDLC